MESWNLTELDSGERVISERLDHVRSVAIGYWIAAGSRDETDERAGISHFIEHLLFKGTSSYGALEIAELFDELGGELNAATAREHTLVYARVPDVHVETALDVMTDMVCLPQFDDLDSEREVVLEEIAMYEDAPQDLVHDLLAQATFGSHPLGRPVLGTAEVISSVSRDALQGYHRSMYVPGNTVVAAAGNLEHDRLVELVREMLGRRRDGVSGTPHERAQLTHPPAPGLRFQRKSTEQYHVCIGAPGVSRSDPRRFAVGILDAVLGGSASSRLFQEIREQRGLAYSVYTFASQYVETGQIGLYLGTRAENLVEALQVTGEQVAGLAGGNLSERELRRAKEHLKGRVLLSMESTSARMSRLGAAVVTGTELLPLERILEEIDAVEAGQVSEVAAELLAPELLSAAAIGPDEDSFLQALEPVTPMLARAA